MNYLEHCVLPVIGAVPHVFCWDNASYRKPSVRCVRACPD